MAKRKEPPAELVEGLLTDVIDGLGPNCVDGCPQEGVQWCLVCRASAMRRRLKKGARL